VAGKFKRILSYFLYCFHYNKLLRNLNPVFLPLNQSVNRVFYIGECQEKLFGLLDQLPILAVRRVVGIKKYIFV
jgi:hypothetical protein